MEIKALITTNTSDGSYTIECIFNDDTRHSMVVDKETFDLSNDELKVILLNDYKK